VTDRRPPQDVVASPADRHNDGMNHFVTFDRCG